MLLTTAIIFSPPVEGLTLACSGFTITHFSTSLYIYILVQRFQAFTLIQCRSLNFKRRMKSRLPFAVIIRRSPYSPRFQDKD